MVFEKEQDFEKSLIEALTQKGWESTVLKNPTEDVLLKNWAKILFDNNRDIDRLNDYPLTDGEMMQIIEQITTLKTPLKLNGFINGKTISIRRDNLEDIQHFGKEVSLKIYDRREIAAGQSRYQIAQQPDFKTKSKILNDRRGDLMLLINGMPVIHIELKRTGVSVSQACNQIEKYMHEGLFTGIFSLIQIFVAMEPTETLYFANPGPEGKFNKDWYFHWADFNNDPINEWSRIASSLLSIPMAHQLIGFYTVADDSDGVLKVLRSYQYYAANAISDSVSKTKWNEQNKLGGYIWHTTGSGKTLTSFKSAQLIANSKDADKVIFLVDRIELGTQSLREYRNFAEENEDVQATEDTYVLISKLKSPDPKNTLIVTSIQKMSNISYEEEGIKAVDLKTMSSKRIVFIVDEAHRSTFGEMLSVIKNTFTSAIFFGFTGTPIQEENQKKMNTTATIFGNELHRYSIADGIRDKNVLGFDPYKVLTFQDKDVKTVIALELVKSTSLDQVFSDPQKTEAFNQIMKNKSMKMAGYINADGRYVKGFEDYLPKTQYRTKEHTKQVVKDISLNWQLLSQNGKFHALFATSSIPEAINYYKLLKKVMPSLKVTCLFDPSIDNEGEKELIKEDGLVEIIEDYNAKYQQTFSLRNYGQFKKDISSRLAHKEPYRMIEKSPEKQIDLLIVVNQMLTGFDSKWINTLYIDKILHYESIIQAFSRTNRLFGPEKPFGTIRYYRYPHTMERNINDAVKLYSGDKPIGLFVEKLEYNLNKLNAIYQEIFDLFAFARIPNFEKLPDDNADRGRFASLFKKLNDQLEAVKIQGFKWSQSVYEFSHSSGSPKTTVVILIDEKTYLVLALRYKELFKGEGGEDKIEIPYEIDGYLTEIDTGKIDSEYMNTRFDKYLVVLEQDNVSETEMRKTLDELHKSFAILTQEEQKYASLFLHDVESGRVEMISGKTFREYITEYQSRAKNDQIHKLSAILGLDENLLRERISTLASRSSIKEFGHFKSLTESVDRQKARLYFESIYKKKLPESRISREVYNLLYRFIESGGFDLDEPLNNDIVSD